MNSAWRFFIVVESLLALAMLWQVGHNTGLLILLFVGIFLIFFAARNTHNKRSRNFLAFLGLVCGGIALFNAWAFWGMLIFGIVFVGLKGVEISGVDLFNKAPWKEKSMQRVDSVTPTPKGGRRYKRPWFTNDRIGMNEVYEWDDINITALSGDTIIDLGNTLLPKNDSVIMVRKGFGRTRILVPAGIGLMVEHSTFVGKVIFNQEEYPMKNEAIKLFSEDYDHNERRLKIVTSSFFGDLEVIFV
ncbi:cell wall-active antibiotics response protein LiaF [Enterococcus timonensis]|uniref:cell wall-active antibiotics response protein LiaF n=1 Tax=Enterococcus timonensis TaxID=1852364 RepID=UPI0008D9A931|nr:cell wall-active antibiotics response protein LiaF [Enterococcus timonensis]